MQIVTVVQTGYLFIVCASCIAAVWILVFLKTSVLPVNKELRDLYLSQNISRSTKSRRMRWVWHVARMGEEM